MMALQALGLEMVKIVGSQVLVGHLVAQHVVATDQQTVGDGEHGPWLAASARDAVIERMQVCAGGAGDGGSDLAQNGLQLSIAFGGRATELPPGTPLVSRTDPGP